MSGVDNRYRGGGVPVRGVPGPFLDLPLNWGKINIFCSTKVTYSSLENDQTQYHFLKCQFYGIGSKLNNIYDYRAAFVVLKHRRQYLVIFT